MHLNYSQDKEYKVIFRQGILKKIVYNVNCQVQIEYNDYDNPNCHQILEPPWFQCEPRRLVGVFADLPIHYHCFSPEPSDPEYYLTHAKAQYVTTNDFMEENTEGWYHSDTNFKIGDTVLVMFYDDTAVCVVGKMPYGEHCSYAAMVLNFIYNLDEATTLSISGQIKTAYIDMAINKDIVAYNSWGCFHEIDTPSYYNWMHVTPHLTYYDECDYPLGDTFNYSISRLQQMKLVPYLLHSEPSEGDIIASFYNLYPDYIFNDAGDRKDYIINFLVYNIKYYETGLQVVQQLHRGYSPNLIGWCYPDGGAFYDYKFFMDGFFFDDGVYYGYDNYLSLDTTSGYTVYKMPIVAYLQNKEITRYINYDEIEYEYVTEAIPPDYNLYYDQFTKYKDYLNRATSCRKVNIKNIIETEKEYYARTGMGINGSDDINSMISVFALNHSACVVMITNSTPTNTEMGYGYYSGKIYYVEFYDNNAEGKYRLLTDFRLDRLNESDWNNYSTVEIIVETQNWFPYVSFRVINFYRDGSYYGEKKIIWEKYYTNVYNEILWGKGSLTKPDTAFRQRTPVEIDSALTRYDGYLGQTSATVNEYSGYYYETKPMLSPTKSVAASGKLHLAKHERNKISFYAMSGIQHNLAAGYGEAFLEYADAKYYSWSLTYGGSKSLLGKQSWYGASGKINLVQSMTNEKTFHGTKTVYNPSDPNDCLLWLPDYLWPDGTPMCPGHASGFCWCALAGEGSDYDVFTYDKHEDTTIFKYMMYQGNLMNDATNYNGSGD